MHLFRILDFVTGLRLLIVFAIFSLSGENALIAQTSHQIFEHLKTDHGLSSNKVEAILQDRDGFYWIATQNGLNRFDGTSFKTFHNKTNDSTSLSHNHCTSILEDRNGDIWVGTYMGLSRYLKKEGHFQQIKFEHPSQSPGVANIIRDIKSDVEGNIWLAGSALWEYDPLTNVSRIFLPDKAGSISNKNNLFDIAYDETLNGLWISPGGEINFYSIAKDTFYSAGYNPFRWRIFDYENLKTPVIDDKKNVWCYDSNTGKIISFDIDDNTITLNQEVSTSSFRKLFIDKNARLWILDWDGRAEVIDLNTTEPAQGFLGSLHPKKYLAEFVRGVFVDQQDNYWIASGEGIHIYSETNNFNSKHIIPPEPGANNKIRPLILSIAQISSQRLSIATNQGLYEYDLETKKTKPLGDGEIFTKIKAQCVVGNFIYLGSKGQLFRMDLSDKTTDKIIGLGSSIVFIYKGTGHDLWVGYWDNGLCRIDTRTLAAEYFTTSTKPISMKSNALVSGFIDSNHVWIGYNGGKGFSKFDLDAHQITHFQPLKGHEQNINGGTITVISGTDNSLWLGTYGGGVFYFDLVANTFKNFNQEHGLSSNYINSIIPDKTGKLWITTADGLDFLNPAANHISHIDIDLASSSNDVDPNGLSGQNEKLYFFSKDYFVEIDPAAYLEMRDSTHLVISSFKVFDQEMVYNNGSPEINLSHNQNFFTFEYSALRTHPDKPVHYSYRLDGFDANWIDAGNKNYASYTNVPGGKYFFQVRSMNRDGQWSNALINIPLVVRPPFWLTWWFIMLAIIFISLVIYSIYRYRINQLRRIYEIKSKISQDLHDDVGASLSSIHIFSSVAEDAIRNNPEKAGKIMQQIKHNSRQVMDNMSDIIWAMNAEQQNNESLIGRIKNYGYDLLSQQNIACTYKIDPQVEKKLQKPEARKNVLLIVKEALNNIAKYSEATQAEVNIDVNNSTININIIDNGKGFEMNSLNGGNGLKNMKLRATALGGNCIYESSPGKGTRIESIIPLANISDG